MSRMKRLLSIYSGGNYSRWFLAAIDQFLYSSTGLLTSIIIGRALTKEDLGLYSLAVTVAAFGLSNQEALISSPYLIKHEGIPKDSIGGYTGSAFVFHLCFSGILVLILGMTGLGMAHYPETATWAAPFLMLVPVLPAILLREFVRRLSLAWRDAATVFYLDFGVAMIQIGFLAAAGYYRFLTVSRAFFMMGIACFISVAFWFKQQGGAFRFRSEEMASHFSGNFRIGKWLALSNLLWLVSTSLYPWLIAGFHGIDATGNFSACLSVVSLANPMIIGLVNAFAPDLAYAHAHQPRNLQRLLYQALAVVGLFMGLFCLLNIVYGGRIVVLVYGPAFGDLGYLVSGLALNILVFAFNVVLSQAFFIREKPTVPLMSNVIGTALFLTAGLLLVSRYALAGAVAGLLSSNLAALFFLIYHAIRQKNRSAAVSAEYIIPR